jgi:hypothetical protein
VTQSSDVLKPEGKQAVIDPTAEVHHVTTLAIAVACIPWFKVIAMETKNAAVVRGTVVKVNVVEEEGRNVTGSDVASQFSRTDDRCVVHGKGWGEQQRTEDVAVD